MLLLISVFYYCKELIATVGSDFKPSKVLIEINIGFKYTMLDQNILKSANFLKIENKVYVLSLCNISDIF